jgi:hypothetical protein
MVTVLPDASTLLPDASTLLPDASTLLPDTSSFPPETATVLPDVSTLPVSPRHGDGSDDLRAPLRLNGDGVRSRVRDQHLADHALGRLNACGAEERAGGNRDHRDQRHAPAARLRLGHAQLLQS